MFPPNFNINIYSEHEDLKNIDKEILINHYNNYGKLEGKICSKIQDRNSLINFINIYHS